MVKKIGFITMLLFVGINSFSQKKNVFSEKQNPSFVPIDTTLDYDFLLEELENFLDSISSPHSYFVGNLSIGKGSFNFLRKSETLLEAEREYTYTPTVSYFHKSGFSIMTTGNLVNYDNKTDLYQFSLSPGYDYLANRNLATGITFTKFFTKSSTPFYTTPLQNELYAYFTYREFWLKPTIALSYGWGNRTDYSERVTLIQDLRLRRDGIIKINSTETINDFSINTSLRHDFYWLNIFSAKDYIRFSPQLSFTSGTQSFGFNQSTNTYGTARRNGANVLYNSENIFLDDQLQFQPLSLTFLVKGEYSIGKIFFQPQLAGDYYFPAKENNFNLLFSLNMGLAF